MIQSPSARPAWARCAGACRCGDQLRLDARVQGVRKSSSRPDLGIITWAWTVLNQHDEAVLELDATSLFDLSGNA